MITTILAYIIIIVLSQFALTIGVMVMSFVMPIINFIIPEKLQSIFLTAFFSIIGGIISMCLVFFFGKIIFSYLVGENSYQGIQFFCSVLGVLMPINNDYKHYKKLSNAQIDLKKTSSNEIISALGSEYDVAIAKGYFIGDVIGVFVFAFYLFIYPM